MDLQLGYFQTAKGFHGVRFPGRNKPAQATKTKKMKNLSIYLFFAMLTGFIFLIAGFILAQVLSYIGGALILESMFWNIILNLIKMTK